MIEANGYVAPPFSPRGGLGPEDNGWGRVVHTAPRLPPASHALWVYDNGGTVRSERALSPHRLVGAGALSSHSLTPVPLGGISHGHAALHMHGSRRRLVLLPASRRERQLGRFAQGSGRRAYALLRSGRGSPGGDGRPVASARSRPSRTGRGAAHGGASTPELRALGVPQASLYGR